MTRGKVDEPLFEMAGLDVAALLESARDLRPVYLVIPVFNGGAAVSRCLDSVRACTPDQRVVVIDDASTDAEVVSDLDRRAARGEIELIRHEQNWGYTRTANQGLRLSDSADVVLMNSDTEVGPLWLENLRLIAHSRRDVATVSALSDNAGAMAMPETGKANDWPTHLTWTEIARAAMQADLPWAMEVPTGHGFCMLITRLAVQQLGTFDEASFPRGYGEENDFCMRAREAGLVNLVAPRVFVKHLRSQSFGPERDALIREGRAVIDARHPGYTADIREWLHGTAMDELRSAFAALREQLAARESVPPRRLYVLHRAGGGTPATNLDLMTALAAYQESYLLETLNARSVELSRVRGPKPERLETWTPGRAFAVTDMWRPDYAEAFAAVLLNLGIELVHVRHLINQPLTTVPEVTHRLRVPLVISTHDFYMSCPSVHLLDESDHFCGGGVCSSGPGTCRLPTPWLAAAPPLKHDWIHEWRRHAGAVFAQADAVVATTNSAAGVLEESYPELRQSSRVIEHGRDLDRDFAPLRTGGTVRLPGPTRILAVANWDPHKGTQYLKDVASLVGPAVEWHVAGERSDQLSEHAVAHGPFRRDSLRKLVAEIDPDLAAIFSIWPETYSHTLTEAWALGLPVLATDIGAVAERIRSHGGGVLLPLEDQHAAAATIAALIRDRHRMDELRRSVPRLAPRSRAAMAEDYRDLYARVGAVRAPKKVGFVANGSLHVQRPTAHIRLLRRLQRAVASGRVSACQVLHQEIDRGTSLEGFDTLMVLRDALGDHTDWAIAEAKKTGTRLVVDVDDDILHDEAARRMGISTAEHDLRRSQFAHLLANANCVIVSTDTLRDRLCGRTDAEIVVVPNRLDPRLYTTAGHKPRVEDPGCRILYMGTATHLDDFKIIQPVLGQLSRALGRETSLELIGVTDVDVDSPTIARLTPPSTRNNYPEFVRWLAGQRHRWTLAIAPLADLTFNHSKSDLKLLEYAMLGLPAIASDVGPYRGRDELALIVENSSAAWLHAIRSIIEDPVQAHRRAQSARDYVLRNRMLNEDDDRIWLRAVLGS